MTLVKRRILQKFYGGLTSIHKGQIEAGKALGMKPTGIQRLIVIPQAFRVALPALGNEYVSIVKLTSLVFGHFINRNSVGWSAPVYAKLFGYGNHASGYILLCVDCDGFGWLIGWFERRIDIANRKPGMLIESDPLLQLPNASIRARKEIQAERQGEYALEAMNIHKAYFNGKTSCSPYAVNIHRF